MRKWFKKIPLLSLGAAGFLFGMILGIISSGGAEYLDSDRLCDMKEMGVEQKDFQERLFYEVLIKRGGEVLAMIAAGTTYLAPAVIVLMALWIGMSMGVFQAVALTNYGIKGILLLPAATLPQFLIYLPAFYVLLRWCERLYGAIYMKKTWKPGHAISVLALVLTAIMIGMLLECHVSPRLLRGTLKIF